MRNNIRHLLLLASMILQLFIAMSCETLRDTYSDFLGDGERVYVGKIDSIQIFSGYERVRVEGLMYFAKTAKEVVVEWEDQTLVTPLDGLGKYDTLKIDINNLSEGSKNFTVYTRDAENNLSVKTEIFCEVYGPLYIKTLIPRSVASIKVLPSRELEITWNEPETNVVDVTLEYIDNSGNKQSSVVDNKTSVTVLDDWKPESELTTYTRVLPKETDLDILTLEKMSYTTPFFTKEVNTTSFEKVADPYVAAGETDWGGKEKGLFDNDESTFINGNGLPNHVSYDMGRPIALVQGKLVVPQPDAADAVWAPVKSEIWGLSGFTEDLTDDMIKSKYPDIKDDFDNKEKWPEEAKSKGWVKLADISYDPSIDKGAVVFNIDSSISVRYIILRLTKVFNNGNKGDGNDVYSRVKELYLWEKE